MDLFEFTMGKFNTLLINIRGVNMYSLEEVKKHFEKLNIDYCLDFEIKVDKNNIKYLSIQYFYSHWDMDIELGKLYYGEDDYSLVTDFLEGNLFENYLFDEDIYLYDEEDRDDDTDYSNRNIDFYKQPDLDDIVYTIIIALIDYYEQQNEVSNDKLDFLNSVFHKYLTGRAELNTNKEKVNKRVIKITAEFNLKSDDLDGKELLTLSEVEDNLKRDMERLFSNSEGFEKVEVTCRDIEV